MCVKSHDHLSLSRMETVCDDFGNSASLPAELFTPKLNGCFILSYTAGRDDGSCAHSVSKAKKCNAAYQLLSQKLPVDINIKSSNQKLKTWPQEKC